MSPDLKHSYATPLYPTPFEAGNQNQTTEWRQCIEFYEGLAVDFPGVLSLFQIGTSDNGLPIHAGVVSSDGVLDRASIKRAGRPVFFNNNGIHPGEPEGDVAWRDLDEVRPAEHDDGAIRVNRWFARHPDFVLGTHATTSGPFGETYTCLTHPGVDLEQALFDAVREGDKVVVYAG